MKSQNLVMMMLVSLLAMAGVACQSADDAQPEAPRSTSTQEQKATEAPAPGNIKEQGESSLGLDRANSRMKAWGSYEEGHKGLTFSQFDASAQLTGARLSGLTFWFDLPSATADDKELGQKLLSDYFFDVAQTARPSFQMTGVDVDHPKAAGGAMLTGDLTLRGKTSSVEFPVDIESAEGATVVKATFPIPRGDFGIPDPGAESEEVSALHPDIYLSLELSFPAGAKK
jgi:polyisoprenoid-binding protein YceI